MRDTLARYEEIKNAADCFQFTDHCFILSRGVFYPMALEAALKLQETNYMNARALSTADFFHGPLAMVQQNTPVVFYAPTDACRPSALELGERLKELGAHVLLFDTDGSAAHIARKTVVLPSIAPGAAANPLYGSSADVRLRADRAEKSEPGPAAQYTQSHRYRIREGLYEICQRKCAYPYPGRGGAARRAFQNDRPVRLRPSGRCGNHGVLRHQRML